MEVSVFGIYNDRIIFWCRNPRLVSFVHACTNVWNAEWVMYDLNDDFGDEICMYKSINTLLECKIYQHAATIKNLWTSEFKISVSPLYSPILILSLLSLFFNVYSWEEIWILHSSTVLHLVSVRYFDAPVIFWWEVFVGSNCFFPVVDSSELSGNVALCWLVRRLLRNKTTIAAYHCHHHYNNFRLHYIRKPDWNAWLVSFSAFELLVWLY